jgi:isopentenyl diphosphate isomerase/L-lactate dehydrogenase-like FMN-dependent dehydrogenase
VCRSTSLTWERRARELLVPGVYDYFAGGSGHEWTLRASVQAWRRYWLAPAARVRDLLTGITDDLAHVMALAGARSVAEIPEVTGPLTGNSLEE